MRFSNIFTVVAGVFASAGLVAGQSIPEAARFGSISVDPSTISPGGVRVILALTKQKSHATYFCRHSTSFTMLHSLMLRESTQNMLTFISKAHSHSLVNEHQNLWSLETTSLRIKLFYNKALQYVISNLSTKNNDAEGILASSGWNPWWHSSQLVYSCWRDLCTERICWAWRNFERVYCFFLNGYSKPEHFGHP